MVSRTGIGAGIGIPFRNIASGGGKPYLSPEVKEALKAVVIAYGKTNNDSDRAIVKNLVDASNPFVISNAAFKLNSGFGKYEITFQYFPYIENVTNVSDSKVVFGIGGQLLIPYPAMSENIPSFKIKVNGLSGTYHFRYYYRTSDGVQHSVNMAQDGYYELPICYNVQSSSDGTNCGFANNGNDVVTITQIPSFEGAFVTDGVDDLITSTKTVQEMLGGSNEITVVSMINTITPYRLQLSYTNAFPINGTNKAPLRNEVSNTGKTGIYGYTYKNNVVSVINNVLGDKNDYTAGITGEPQVDDRFEVTRTKFNSSVAWYWTFIAKKALTTDQINQVIAYFNLDRTLKPDILCNTIKQGITNDNHAEFGDKLIDFSGNGRDIQLNNIAWKGDSGIGKYNVDFDSWIPQFNIADSVHTSNKLCVTRIKAPQAILYTRAKVNSMKVEVKGSQSLELFYQYVDKDDNMILLSLQGDGIYDLPASIASANNYYTGFRVSDYTGECDITITQIPSHAGALCLDGVNDFGQFVGDLGLKDYTLIMNRAYNNLINNQVPLVSSNIVEDQTPFIVEHWNTGSNAISFSYGASRTTDIPLDINKKIVYQSTYSYMGYVIPKGNAISTGGGITLGKFGNGVQYSAICLWSLMLFPYSMSEFLIERQLKKHKLGTLYPDMVEFRPIVKSNSEYQVVDCYIDTFPAVVGNYYPINSKLRIAVTTKGAADEVTSLTVNGVSLGTPGVKGNRFTFNGTLSDKSPQKINITIDEYIRYEDIVQPYPVLLRFKDENGNEVSWGGKFKVGSTITRIGSIADPESNLLNGLYSISGLSLNGKGVTSSTSIVEKQMVFKTIATYLLDNNEPKCILSPRLLRIPNSSYKILGHIPDISGHGNHGKINNSAYKLNSGVNGYLVDFTTLKDDGIKGIVRTDSKIYLDKSFNYNQGFWLGRTNNPSPAYKVKVSGIPETGMLTYTGGVWLNLVNGINELPARTNTEEEHGFVIQSPNLDWSNLVIEQIGEYEGAYCLDGVDDFVTIPTVTGGKQVLMKVNWQSDVGAVTLYDQRLNLPDYEFAIYNGTRDLDDNPVIAYQRRNNGQTYIDGILNSNIMASELKAITHNITITNELSLGTNNTYPVIGSTRSNTHFAQMSLYDFMLFDDISTDDKIKELNEYVGIEAKVELPPYYWDAYGKSNLDEDRDSIKQRGVAVGDYDLTNYNHTYEGMSGYNGYPIILSGNNRTYQDTVSYVNVVGDDKNVINLTRISFNTAAIFSYVKKNGELTSYNKDIESFKIKVTGIDYSRFVIKYSYISEANATAKTTMTIASDSIYELPKSFASDGSLTSSDVWIGINFTKQSNDIPDIIEDVNVTIEVLPEYENGLVYDGAEDFSKNANIPALDDFTAIIKREWLKKQGCPLIKGSKVYEGGNGNALLLEWDKAYNFVFYKRTDIMEGELPDNISFITPTNYNGNVITRGSEQDTNGICIAGDGNAGFANMVFYKLILYPKTIPLLQINFLKNLMEKDEIIDLNNPIFIQE